MANWYGAWRTNYVKLRADRIDALELFEVKLSAGNDGTYALLSENEYGDCPSCYVDADEDTQIPEFLTKYVIVDEYLDLTYCIHEFLEEGEVIVIQSTGAEKLRYLTGYSLAIHSSGKTVGVNIDDIYDKAKAEFGLTELSTATY